MPPRKNAAIRIFDGYAMRLKKTRKDGVQLYYCMERNRHSKCGASCLFDSTINTCYIISPHDRHDKDSVKSDSYLARNDLKIHANDGNPREVIDKVRNEYSAAVSLTLGSYNAKRHVIYNARGKKNADTINMNNGGAIAPEFKITVDGKQFLIVDKKCGSGRMLGFASEKGLDILSKCTVIMADGTFNVAPNDFCQLFTIHGFITENVVRPLVFFLLPDKKTETYRTALSVLKNRQELASWAPTMIMIDYEAAVKNAFCLTFPSIEVAGCLFHLIQAWRREAEKVKIYEDFITGTITDFWARLKAIPFLEPADCRKFFNSLLETVPAVRPVEIDEFLHYLERNYMSAFSRFPSEMWSCNERTMNHMHRTTNAVECWHRMMESIVSEKNGLSTVSMSDFIQKIRQEDSHTCLDAEELRINPNHKVNKSRTVVNILKDRALLVTLKNNPPKPNLPLTGIRLLDAIAFASKC